MTRNIYEEVKEVAGDSVYLVRENGVINYGDRWAYGYAVPIRPLKTSDFKQSTLFVTNGEDDFAFANHVDALQDAQRLARSVGQPRIFSLRDRSWVKS